MSDHARVRLATAVLAMLSVCAVSARRADQDASMAQTLSAAWLAAEREVAALSPWGAAEDTTATLRPDGEVQANPIVGVPTDAASYLATLAAGDTGADDDAAQVQRICRVTAYCDNGTTASGVPSGLGQCAAPADIPLGSTVYIPALDRTFVVTDRTHRRFRRSTVDLFIPNKAACKSFGRHFLECEFTLPGSDSQ